MGEGELPDMYVHMSPRAVYITLSHLTSKLPVILHL